MCSSLPNSPRDNKIILNTTPAPYYITWDTSQVIGDLCVDPKFLQEEEQARELYQGLINRFFKEGRKFSIRLWHNNSLLLEHNHT